MKYWISVHPSKSNDERDWRPIGFPFTRKSDAVEAEKGWRDSTGPFTIPHRIVKVSLEFLKEHDLEDRIDDLDP